MRKREDEIVIESLGFPVVLKNVPMRDFRGEWEPDIDWDALQHLVLLALAHKPVPLTGNEVRFVRQFIEMTLEEFATACGLRSHQAVMNWEKKEDEPTGMHKSTEIVLRARILEVLPEELWERLDDADSPKELFSRRLESVSQFAQKNRDIPLSVVADRDSQLDYSYAS